MKVWVVICEDMFCEHRGIEKICSTKQKAENYIKKRKKDILEEESDYYFFTIEEWEINGTYVGTPKINKNL